MRIPNYEASKEMIDDDHGCIIIYSTKDGCRDKIIFIIHHDGEMELSLEVRQQAYEESEAFRAMSTRPPDEM